MKKLLLAAVAAGIFATPAAAQTAANPITAAHSPVISVGLSGTLDKRCTVSAFLNGPFSELNLENPGVQGSESLSSKCNYPGYATLTIKSANGGKLKSGSNELGYTFSLSGGFATDANLSSDLVITNFHNPANVNTDFTRSMSVKLANVATVAGTYQDTLTISIQPN
ncbi:hypothetical protein [Sphingomonas arenae]|uniref:hypothetical protein n=1 Tax=Sphingomonas arenae TaxID=2812555 RepID=UPI0019676757|nr:hypothetical protein [Sphingomonas arenae]